MILSDVTLGERIDDLFGDDTTITDEQIQPASIDVRFGPELYDQNRDKFVELPEHYHELVPGKPYLGHTLEYVTLPYDIAALLTGRSSIGRRNIVVHQTAGWVDPGFEGELTFELMNFGDDVQALEVGERVAQLVFLKLDRPSTGYDGKYQGQTGARRDRVG